MDKEFERVFEAYSGVVFKFLLKLSRDANLAEEMTQECFYRAFKNYPSYNGTCEITTWLCQIAKNIYYDYIKQKKPVSLDNEPDLQDESLYILDDIIQKESAEQIHKILHSLCEPYKEVFSLRVFAELPFKEIGYLFGKTDTWARVTFYRAKSAIIENMYRD